MTTLHRMFTLAAMAATTWLAACGGGGDASADATGTAAAAPAASTVAGCTGKAAAFFLLAKGSYTATAATFDNVNFASTPAAAAGIANGSSQTVTVAEDCTVKVGTLTLSYKDGSYAEFPGTGADLGKTQYDVDLTDGRSVAAGAFLPHLERFTNGKRGLSLFDTTNANLGVRLDE